MPALMAAPNAPSSSRGVFCTGRPNSFSQQFCTKGCLLKNFRNRTVERCLFEYPAEKIKKIFKFVDNSQNKAGAYILRQKIVLVDSFYKRFCIGYSTRSAKTCFNKGYVRDIERIYFIKFFIDITVFFGFFSAQPFYGFAKKRFKSAYAYPPHSEAPDKI